MAPLPPSEFADLAAKLQVLLSSKPYACSSLEQLTGGTTSFVFLGTLSTQLLTSSSKQEYVIVKHAAPFASCHTEFLLDAGRAKYETLLLTALMHFNPVPAPSPLGNTIHVPKSYLYNAEQQLQVIQYIPHTAPLHKSLASLPKERARTIGLALGHWLRSFHSWTDAPAQHELRETVRQNTHALSLKHNVIWTQATAALRLLSSQGEIMLSPPDEAEWDAARARAAHQISHPPRAEAGIVHGDFWAGNVLVSVDDEESRDPDLHVIDFEFCHAAPSRATDLGQFIGDLAERGWISPQVEDVAAEVARGFVEGYGEMGEELRWRTAVGVGVHVVNWWSRGPAGRRDQSDEVRRRGVKLVEQGLRWVRGGWEKDASAFEGTLLWPLVESVEVRWEE